jgi:hypothetical protein
LSERFDSGKPLEFSGWEGMMMRLEFDAYRPPWTHRYKYKSGEIQEPFITATFSEGIDASGLKRSPAYLHSLAHYKRATGEA